MPAKPYIRESDIEAYLVKRVKAQKGEVRKVEWIGRRGAPDRIAMLPERQYVPTSTLGAMVAATYRPSELAIPSRTIWIELKAPGKKAEPHQAREHERMRKMGQRVEVVDSFERVDEVLK
jgi:hypothetical protein